MDEHPKHDDESSEELESGWATPSIAVMPDGLPAFQAASIGQPTPVPPRTPENFVCLRGPCKHYWYLETMANAGNPADTWEALGVPEPRQRHYICLISPSQENDWGENNVYKCSKWEPLLLAERLETQKRREQWRQEQEEENADEQS